MTRRVVPLAPARRRVRRLRVLVSAYACHPHEGSEPSVGWHWLQCIAQRHDVWLLTEAQRYAEPVAQAIADDRQLRDSVRVIGIPRVRAAERWLGPLAYYRTYRRWQLDAFERAQELHQRIGFDLAHQLNMIGYREPGYLWQLDIPLIWGPVGGFAQAPWRYLAALGIRGGATLAVRNVVNAIQMRTSTRVRRAMSHAHQVIAATRTDQQAMGRHYLRVTSHITETGCRVTSHVPARVLKPGEPLQVLWCGLLMPRKAAGIALRAVALASKEIQIRFDLYGHSGAAEHERALAARLGIGALCTFHGRVAHNEMPKAMRRAHVLLFPSLLEATSATVPEALSMGLPVLCHAVCGHGDIVDESCGVRVQLATPTASARQFAAALIALARDPARLRELSIGAACRSRSLRWHHKTSALEALYREAAESKLAREAMS